MRYRSSAINVNVLRQSYLKLKHSAQFLNLVIRQKWQVAGAVFITAAAELVSR